MSDARSLMGNPHDWTADASADAGEGGLPAASHWHRLVSAEELDWQSRIDREIQPLVETVRRLRERDLLE